MKIFACGIAMAALWAPAAGWSAESPSHEGPLLIIPRVDTPEQIGMYQDGVMRRNADGTWSITSLKWLGQGVTKMDNVAVADVVATTSVPVAVYLKVLGAEGRCGNFKGPERIHQRRTGSHIDVTISMELEQQYGACPMAMRPYRVTVPLDVYGLPAGTYTFTVNGAKSGTFTLQQDNKFADDCPVNRDCPIY